MPFEKGRQKIGGRKKGSLNKKTLMMVDEILSEKGVNPIEKLIQLAVSDLTSIEQKINCYKEVAKYTYSKPREQHSQPTYTNNEGSVEVRIVNSDGSVRFLD